VLNIALYRIAGWSSLVARQAHNLKAVGSNPTPATNFSLRDSSLRLFCWQGLKPYSKSCPGVLLWSGMKRNLLGLFCALAVAWLGSSKATAANQNPDAGAATIADIAIVRPVCLAATVVGSAFFVVSLPLAFLTHSVDKTADALVRAPARATFTRPLGDMDALKGF
jgi:hypothetical protein